MQKAAPPPAAGLHEEEADDGWVLLRAGGSTSDTATPAGRPPRPPLRGGRSPGGGGQTSPPFDPATDDLVGSYLPARRTLRCGDLPPQIHDADVYGAHHSFLAKLHPPANADRPEWLC